MAQTINDADDNGYAHPLYVRIPKSQHDYLDSIKEQTGISKSDAVTLFLHVAGKLIDANTLLEMFDEYMLEGDVVRTLKLRVERTA